MSTALTRRAGSTLRNNLRTVGANATAYIAIPVPPRELWLLLQRPEDCPDSHMVLGTIKVARGIARPSVLALEDQRQDVPACRDFANWPEEIASNLQRSNPEAFFLLTERTATVVRASTADR